MPINLNTSTSVVDFLRSQNKPSDFASRKSTYENLGLTGAFGDYRGTAEQNVTLLNKIKMPVGVVQYDKPIGPELPPIKTEDIIDETTPTAPFDPTKAAEELTAEAQKEAEAEKKELTMGLGAETTR